MKSPEEKIKDEIRVEYAKTYPNIIFNLINHVDILKAQIAEAKKELTEEIIGEVENIDESFDCWVTEHLKQKYLGEV